MKRIELEIEHTLENRFVGRHRFKGENDLAVIGSSRDAQIRLLGTGVSHIHAYVEFDGESWKLIDACSDKGTWVKKKPIVCLELNNSTTAQIGDHCLKITPRLIEADLFSTDKELIKDTGSEIFHQVVIKKEGLIVQSNLLKQNQNFDFHFGGESHILAPPKSKEWTVKEFGAITVQQRLVNTATYIETTEDKIAVLSNPEIRIPGAIAGAALLFFLLAIFLSPNNPEMDELKPLDLNKNKYTRMIIDAKGAKQKRAAAKKIRKQISNNKKKAASPTPNKQVKVAKSQGKPPKVVSKLKNSGLSKLLGKISMRAAKNSVLVKTSGRLAKFKNTGRAIASTTVSGKAPKLTGNSKSKFKLNTVGTGNVSQGGASAIKALGGLAAGSVGTSTVGVLEEETEIQGGLDKEVIAKYINGRLGEVKYCYERQLSANPDLYGKVLVKFTIGSEGGVSSQAVGLSTLKNAMVEGCILRRIARWRFPKPKGGTTVVVSYPFLFKSTN